MTELRVQTQLFRIADANTNRIGEGLRVLEEVARFVLNDAGLSEQLKSLRHEISIRDVDNKLTCLSARDSQNDVGAEIQVRFQSGERGLIETITANARRVEEALRVMEEISVIKGISAFKENYARARFQLYEIEKTITSLATRGEITLRICGLYAVVDSDCLNGRNLLETVAQILAGGVKLVQLRDKNSSQKQLYELAVAVKILCAKNDAIFIINDHLDIALASEADGVHLGQSDFPVNIARGLLPINKIIGCSVTTVDEAKQAKADGADYLGCGAVYPTLTKPDCPVVGLDALRLIKKAVDLPLVAIGGINIENISEVFATGVDAVAVMSAVTLAHSPAIAVSEMLKRIEACHEQA